MATGAAEGVAGVPVDVGASLGVCCGCGGGFVSLFGYMASLLCSGEICLPSSVLKVVTIRVW